MSTLDRLYRNWVYGGFLAAFLLLGFIPLLIPHLLPVQIWVYALLPTYMLHQLEEHDADRFRIFANTYLGHGREVLSHPFVFVVNVPGVWGVNFVSIVLSICLAPAYGLIGAGLVLVNAVAHVGQALKMRRYNPGLITAVLLFLPVGGITTWQIFAHSSPSPLAIVIGFGSAILIHAWIILHVKRQLSSR